MIRTASDRSRLRAVCNDGGVANKQTDVERSHDDVDVHTHLLNQPLGRWVVALILTVGTFWIVVPNIPGSAIRDDVSFTWEPARQLGLEQDWAVFSPNPRNQSVDVRARIEFEDGTIDFWDVPEFDPTIGAFRQYRWHKWQERVRLDNHEKYWKPTAEWLADQHVRDGIRPRQITLIRRWIDHEPLTPDGPTVNIGWNEFEFFVWERDV